MTASGSAHWAIARARQQTWLAFSIVSPFIEIFPLGIGNLGYASALAFLPHSLDFAKALRTISEYVVPYVIAIPWAVAGLGSLIGGLFAIDRVRYWAAILSGFAWAYQFWRLGDLTHWQAPGLWLELGMIIMSLRIVLFSCRGV